MLNLYYILLKRNYQFNKSI